MKNVLFLLFVFTICGLKPVIADQSEFAQKIMRAGISESDERRTSVLVDGCSVETFVFEPFEDQGLVLYSRFVFELGSIEIVMLNKKELEYFYDFSSRDSEKKTAIFGFRTIQPYMAAHEMPNYRIRKNKLGVDAQIRTPSERTGANGYHFIENHDFIFIMENLDTLDQARLFVNSLRHYQIEYCRPLG